jgi:hypothetical protein
MYVLTSMHVAKKCVYLWLILRESECVDTQDRYRRLGTRPSDRRRLLGQVLTEYPENLPSLFGGEHLWIDERLY